MCAAVHNIGHLQGRRVWHHRFGGRRLKSLGNPAIKNGDKCRSKLSLKIVILIRSYMIYILDSKLVSGCFDVTSNEKERLPKDEMSF